MSVTASLTALERDVINETYADLQKFVYLIAHRFAAGSGLPFEDLRSVADFYYVKAYKSYRPDCGAKLITWVGFVVTKQLQTHLKKEFRFKNTHQLCEINEDIVGFTTNSSFLLELREFCGEDANLIVDLLLDSNSDLQVLLKWRTKGKNVTRTKAKQVLIEHLEDIGWTKDRIAQSFEEIAWLLSKV